MKLEELVAMLEQLGVFKVKHSGRTLGDHLLNTYEMITMLTPNQEVALAGACHSLYGTGSFQTYTLNYDNRDFLRTKIGNRAEELAYLFSVLNRPECFNEVVPIRNRLTGELTSVSSPDWMDLQIIEIANLMEQRISIMRYPLLYKRYVEDL